MKLCLREYLVVAWGSEPDKVITGVAMAFGSQCDVEWKEASKKRGVD